MANMHFKTVRTSNGRPMDVQWTLLQLQLHTEDQVSRALSLRGRAFEHK